MKRVFLLILGPAVMLGGALALAAAAAGWQCTGTTSSLTCRTPSGTYVNYQDTDPIDDPRIAGTVTIDNISIPDICVGTTMVNQYNISPSLVESSSGNVGISINVACPAGTSCSAGACLAAAVPAPSQPSASLTAPQLIRPVNNASVTTSPITFEWSAVSGASVYRLQLFDNSNRLIVAPVTATASYNLVPTTLITGQRYVWTVTASNAAGQSATSSLAYVFTFNYTGTAPVTGTPPVAPDPTLPPNNANSSADTSPQAPPPATGGVGTSGRGPRYNARCQQTVNAALNDLRKYDANRNGLIEIDERNKALQDRNARTLGTGVYKQIIFAYRYQCRIGSDGAPPPPVPPPPVAGNLVVTGPAAGTVLKPGTDMTVTWTGTIPADRVFIALCKGEAPASPATEWPPGNLQVLAGQESGATFVAVSSGTHTAKLDANLADGEDYFVAVGQQKTDQCAGCQIAFSAKFAIKKDGGGTTTGVTEPGQTTTGGGTVTPVAGTNFVFTAPTAGSPFRPGDPLTISWTGSIDGLTLARAFLYKGTPPTGVQSGWPALSPNTGPYVRFNDADIDITKTDRIVSYVPSQSNYELSPTKGQDLVDGADYYIALGDGKKVVASQTFIISRTAVAGGGNSEDGTEDLSSGSGANTNFNFTAPTAGSPFRPGDPLTISWTGTVEGLTNAFIELYQGTPPVGVKQGWPDKQKARYIFNDKKTLDITKNDRLTTLMPGQGNTGPLKDKDLPAGDDYYIVIGNSNVKKVVASKVFSLKRADVLPQPGGGSGEPLAEIKCSTDTVVYNGKTPTPDSFLCYSVNPASAYKWEVKGGAVATESSQGPTTPGFIVIRPLGNGSSSINVILTVYKNADRTGPSDTATEEIMVTTGGSPVPQVNLPPEIQQFYVVEGPSSRLKNNDISFIMQACDPNNDALAAHLEYGDGASENFTLSGCSAVARVHKYASSGNKKAIFVVSDGRSAEVRRELNLTILESLTNSPGGNWPPEIRNFRLAGGSPVVGSTVTFEYDVCDPDNDAVVVDLIYGDNQRDLGLPHVCGTSRHNHVFAGAGVYTVSLSARDSRNGVTSTALTVQISEATNASQFFAQFSWAPPNPIVGEVVNFSAADSRDSFGTITRYDWDFTNDGIYDLSTASSVASWTFNTGGTYNVRLRIVDSRGASTEAVKAVNIGGDTYAGGLANGMLVRTLNNERVYHIMSNQNGTKLLKHWLPDASVFLSYGYRWDDIRIVDPGALNQLPRIKVIKLANSADLYYLTEGDQKRKIPNDDIFRSYGNVPEDIVTVNQTEFNWYPNNVLFHLDKNPNIYLLENGRKRWIKTEAAFRSRGYRWDQVAVVNTTEFNYYPNGSVIE